MEYKCTFSGYCACRIAKGYESSLCGFGGTCGSQSTPSKESLPTSHNTTTNENCDQWNPGEPCDYDNETGKCGDEPCNGNDSYADMKTLNKVTIEINITPKAQVLSKVGRILKRR
jgi:hypothetical protein